MVDRWRVRECPGPEGHGLHRQGALVCATCFRPLSEPFDVVRAVGARTSDPDTSKLAALKQEPRRHSQRGRILTALRHYGPMTSREIADRTGIGGAWKRISELKQGGHVIECGTRHDDETDAVVTVYGIPASYRDVDGE